MQYQYSKFLKPIEQAQNILVAPHLKPDGDALGSITAITELLKQKNKKFQLFCATEIPNQFNYLISPNHFIHEITEKQILEFDLIITVDCGDSRRAGLPEIIFRQYEPFIINIDHHPTNDFFGQLNIVNPKASSTCEIVYELYSFHKLIFNQKISESILTGLITDTGNFSNGATTEKSLKYTSQLLKNGANLNRIINTTFNNKSIPSLQFWGEVLSRLKENKTHGIAYTVITKEDWKKYNLTAEVIDGIANYLTVLDGYKFVLLLREEEDGKIKGSLRTTNKKYDLSKLAQFLGGGGHKQASGFTLDQAQLQRLDQGWQII